LTRPLRIALTADPEIPVPPRLYGGIERVVDMLARGLAARGHEVTLFAHPESRSAGRLVPWPGRSSVSLRDTVANSATLSRDVLRGRFDLVHSFSRVAYLLPTLPLPVPKLMTYQRAISRRSVHLGHSLSRGTLWFSAISRWMMGHVQDCGTWRVVFNGVPLDTYRFSADPGDDAPLVFLGRLEEIKGPHLAIEVALRAERRLILAGNVPPEHRPWFEREVEPRVDGRRITYVGPVDDAQKNRLLGSASALLMPVLWEEPFGIVMAEALACGTPVIGLARGAVPEVVEHGVTGFVERDVDGLVSATRRIGEIDRGACRSRAERLFSDVAVVDRYVEIYREMQEARRGGLA
jgi:glycosyltransferase involved in cell wall biosynthesis